MRLSPIVTALAAVIALVVVGAGGLIILQPPKPLLGEVTVSLSRIRPNGDGTDNVTIIKYTVNRDAKVTIAFTNKTTNTRYVFRNAQARPAGTFQVEFSGIVDGYVLPGENPGGEVETRLIPNGEYTWSVDAETDAGEKANRTGPLTVAEGDTALPGILDFTVSPTRFTPNQDGIDDRIKVNISLAKAADLTVYLQSNTDGLRYYVPERDEGRKPGEAGAHVFDYDGGVDNHITPPVNGEYTVIAIAQDKVGQRIRRTSAVTIADSGLPNAEIVPQPTGGTVRFLSAPYDDSYYTTLAKPGKAVDKPSDDAPSLLARISMKQGDLLVFKLTVSNYGSTPLRTIGPWPGTVYQFDQTPAAMSQDPRSGAWRVGLMCEGSETNLPYRWAIGSQDQLTRVTSPTGESFWYLLPGQKAVVWGAIHMTEYLKTRNPQECWAALIHEDVEIPAKQDHVGAIKVDLTPLDAAPAISTVTPTATP